MKKKKTNMSMIKNINFMMVICLLALGIFIYFQVIAPKPEPTLHNSEETEKLRHRFEEKMVGVWHLHNEDKFRRMFVQFTFYEDGSLNGVEKIQYRVSEIVDAKSSLSFWQTLLERNYLKGRWVLYHDEHDKTNNLQLNALVTDFDVKSPFNISHSYQFDNVTQEHLYINYMMYDHEPMPFVKGYITAPF